MAKNTGWIIVNGKVVGGRGAGGIPFVAALPAVADASENTIYFRYTDETFWYVGSRTVAAVPATPGAITTSAFALRSGYTWSGYAIVHPTGVTDAAYYFNTQELQFYTKPSGPLEAFITQEDFATTVLTWLDESDSDPTPSDTTVINGYFNTDTRQFRTRQAGDATSVLGTGAATFRGGTGTFLGVLASDPSPGTTRETYFSSTLLRFRQHSGDGNWFSVGPAGVLEGNWLGANDGVPGSDQVSSRATAITYFDNSGYDGGSAYHFYNADTSTIESVTSFTPAPLWVDSDIATVSGESTAVFLDAVSTESEAASHYENVGFSAAQEDYYYDTDLSEIRHITAFTASVAWVLSSLESAVNDAAAYLISVETEAAVVSHFDDDANDYTGRPFFYNLTELLEVTAYTATVMETPEHEVPEFDQVPTSGLGGLTQAQVDARVRLLGLLATESTDVATQVELDAIDTANRVAFASVTAAFPPYSIGDFLVYDSTNSVWVRVFTIEGTGIVDLSGGFPTPAASYLTSIGVLGSNLYRCIDYLSASVQAGGDFSPYTNANYLGARSVEPGLQEEHVNNFYYDSTHHYFRRGRLAGGLIQQFGWVYVSPLIILGSNASFLGEFNSRQEALNRIGTYDSTKIYYAYYGGEVHVLDGSTYTAPVSPVTRYAWVHANADIARMVAELESQLSLHWDSVLPDRRITGNTTETFDFDIGQLAAFLGIDRSYAELTLSFTYEPSASVTGTVVATLLHGTDTIVDETLNFLTDTEQSVSVSARITDATNGISLRLAVSGLSDVSDSVLFTGITLNIVGGFVPEASQIEFDTTQFTRRLDPSTIQTLQQFVDFFDAISYPSLPEVADQAALDAVSTTSIMAFAKVTGVFATWQINDVIFWNGTAWTLFLRVDMLSLPTQITSDEIESPIETLIRSFSPENIFDFIRRHETRPWTTSFMDAVYRTTLSSQSGVEFNFNTVGGNTYLRFNSLTSHRQAFVEGLEVGSVIGFFNMTARTTELFRVTVNGDYASDTGLPVGVPDGYAGHLNATDSYLIEFSQGLPDLGQTEAEVVALIESNVPSPFRNTDVPIPFGQSFLHTPIAWESNISGVLLGEDSDDLDDSYAGFIFNTVSGQEYIQVQGLSTADQSFFASLGSGVIIGFYRGGVRQSLAMVSGDYDATNGLPISNRLGSLTTTYVQYDFFLSEDRPIAVTDPTPGADGLPARSVIVDRVFETGTITAANQIALAETGNTGTVGISQSTDLPIDYLEDILVGSAVTMHGQTSDAVRIGTITSKTTAETTADLTCAWTTNTGTFTDGETVQVGFGYVQQTQPFVREQVLRSPSAAQDNQGYIDINATESIERVVLRDRVDDPYFSVTPADLGNNRIGFASQAFTGVTVGGTSPDYSGFLMLAEEHDATNGNRWVARYGLDVDGITAPPSFSDPISASSFQGYIGDSVAVVFSSVGSGGNLTGILDVSSELEIQENLTIGEVAWDSTNRRLTLTRSAGSTVPMSGYWATNNADHTLYLLFTGSGLTGVQFVEILPEHYTTSTTTEARWVLPDTHPGVAILNALAASDRMVLVIASNGLIPQADRSSEHLYLRLSDNDRAITLSPPANHDPSTPETVISGAIEWVSAWDPSITSRRLVAGAAANIALYNGHGDSLYTASAKRIVYEQLIVKSKQYPRFCSFQHLRMDEPGIPYEAGFIWPDDPQIEASRRNLFGNRKFVLGRVFTSSDNGLIIPELDIRSGVRGDVDLHLGETTGSPLLLGSVVRPSKGTWRFYANINLLTRQEDLFVNMRLLQIKNGADIPITQVAFGAGDSNAEENYLFSADVGVDTARATLESRPIYCDGETDFALVYGIIQPTTRSDIYNWKGGNFRWGFEFVGD